jgi:hypothetical protein
MRTGAGLLATILAVAVTGCGSSGSSSSAGGGPGATTATTATTATPAPLSAEATSAATGDIPDNQIFLVYVNPSPRYSIKYPEGWTRQGGGTDVTFRDKNNVVHIAIATGAPPDTAAVARGLAALRASNPALTYSAPALIRTGSASVVKASYTTASAPNPVTGKRVTLLVDRYVIPSAAGRYAIVDLGTPRGVDNVDAYRMMINSFSWR